MKIRFHLTGHRIFQIQRREQSGFALIATITLMILLALLSIGLLTMATTQLRISEQTLHASEAKAQAKLALGIAIDRLQCELGPDQRISANSGILDSSPETETIDGVANPNILGVWNSWDTWLNRPHSLLGVTIDSTYQRGREALFRTWLISSRKEDLLKKTTGVAKDLGAYGGDMKNKIVLLDEGTLGRSADTKKKIYADLVVMSDATAGRTARNKSKAPNQKSIAWWVSAENQKARINLPKYKSEISSELNILQNTWNTPVPSISSMSDLDELASALPGDDGDSYDLEVRKLISRGSVNLMARSSGRNNFGKSYHDVSLSSEGLLVNTKFGGTKNDINILFSQDELPDDFRTRDGDVGLRPYDNNDGSPSVKTRPIGSWHQLYYWANLWDSSKQGEGQDASAALQWDGQTPYSYVAADAESVGGMMNNKFTYLRHPVLLKMYLFWGYQYERDRGVDQGPGNNGGYCNVWASLIPVIVWWNPYNISLRMEGANGQAFGSYTAQYRIMPMVMRDTVEFWHNGDTNMADEAVLSPYYHYPRGSTNTKHDGRLIDDFGASMRKTATVGANSSFGKNDVVVMRPGEVIVFTLPTGDKTTVRNDRKTEADRKMDYSPFKLGNITEESDDQFAPFAVRMYSNWRYDRLDGDEYPEPEGDAARWKLTYWLNFATKYSNTNPFFESPADRILSFRYTDEYSISNKELGAFVQVAGLLDPAKAGTQYKETDSDPEIFNKIIPSVFNMNWGAWEESFGENIKPPQARWDNKAYGIPDGASENDIKRGRYGKPREEYPFFGAYFGISAKWDSTPLVGAYPKNKDYRSKTWQHSSPIFWGGQMIKPSELGRTYHPYWFEVKQGIDSERISIANIISADTKGKTPFAGPGSECTVDSIAATELPLHPPFSLAGFAGARLSPGWYNSGNTAPLVAKRFAYQSGVPGVGIGNSFADPMLPATSIFSSNNIYADEALSDFWDHAFMANDGLWDLWFASSLSARPSSLTGGGNKVGLEDVLKQAFTADSDRSAVSKLPNKRFLPKTNGLQAEQVIQELTGDDGYTRSAKYLTVQGAFNVNSTSSEAWKATLLGLKDRKILASPLGRNVTEVSPSRNETFFSRFGIALNTVSHVDDYGSVGILKGIQSDELNAWSDLRKIDESGMEDLARELVKEVKKRGPFLNMSEFINRRLAQGETGLKGALQAAIDNSGLNRDFTGLSGSDITPAVTYPNQQAGQGSAYTAAPGYLIQSDVLAVLGNILTVRDDTFTIRAYGRVSNPDGAILGQAWCEATVQRGIDYVDPSDSPETPVTRINVTSGALQDGGLSQINKTFGRQFHIVSFRWLSAEEV